MVQGAQVANRPNGKVNKHEALAYALQGMTYTDIGKKYGVTQGAISQLLAKERDDILAYKAFTANKDTFFEYEQWKLAKVADDDTRKKNMERRGYTDIGILQDKIQALRGLPSDISLNVSVVKTLDERSKELRSMLNALSKPLDVGDNDMGKSDNCVDDKPSSLISNNINNIGDEPSLHNQPYQRSLVSDTGQGEPGQRRKGRRRKG